MHRWRRSNRSLGVALVALLLLAVTRVVGAAEPPAVRQLAARGVLRGYPRGRFEPNRPVTRLELAVILARLLRAVEANPSAAQPARRPAQGIRPASLPRTVPAWARADYAFVVSRGYARSQPALCRNLQRPVRQQELVGALCWALASLAERGFIPPGDLAPPPSEPKLGVPH